MKKHLEDLNFNLTYEESPGDHRWMYWDTQIQRVLEWLAIQK
jgi:putative tributyrin esterase